MPITGSVDIGGGLRVVTIDELPTEIAVDGLSLAEYLPCGSLIIDERDGTWYRVACATESGGTEDRNLVPSTPGVRTIFFQAKYEPSSTKGNFAV